MDITNVTVSNDDAGNLKFVIEIPSHQTLPAQKFVGLYIDADRNNATGSAGYEFLVWIEGPQGSTSFQLWNSGANAFIAVSGFPVASRYDRGVETIEFNRSNIGSVSIFNFAVYTWPAAPPSEDRTDVSGRWTYEVKIAQPPPPPPAQKVAITSFSRQPYVPVAGESFTVSVTVRRVGWAGQFNGTVHCEARIAGRRARWFGSVDPGRAACRWDIPAGAVGDTIRGSIGVSDGESPVVTRRFSARIAPQKATLFAGGASREQPRAGHRFYYALTVFVRTGGTERRIRSGTVDCKAIIGGRALEVSEEVILKKEGVRCAWEVPTGTGGRTLVGTIVVQSEGATLKHTFKRRIR